MRLGFFPGNYPSCESNPKVIYIKIGVTNFLNYN